MKYLQSGDKQEQRGRAEDGPVGLKHKWTDWPHVSPGADLIASGKKRAPSKGASPRSAKSSPSHTSKPTTNTGAGKK